MRNGHERCFIVKPIEFRNVGLCSLCCPEAVDLICVLLMDEGEQRRYRQCPYNCTCCFHLRYPLYNDFPRQAPLSCDFSGIRALLTRVWTVLVCIIQGTALTGLCGCFIPQSSKQTVCFSSALYEKMNGEKDKSWIF